MVIMFITENKTACITVAHKANPLLFDYTVSDSDRQTIDSYTCFESTIISSFHCDMLVANITRKANSVNFASLLKLDIKKTGLQTCKTPLRPAFE